MRSKLYRCFLLILPALLIAGFFMAWFAVYGLYPFGEDTISWCDMNQQVVPLLLDFKDILENGSGFFLSFANGAGMNFWGVFFFFLASPFSFLVLLVDKSQLLGFMNVLTVLKLCCCALTANLYFQKGCRRDGLTPWAGVLLSLLYALGGYGFLYYQNSIWLDEMYLFPLLLLSLETLLEEKRKGPYIVAITAVVVVNYYISYMVILFVLLYMGLHFFLTRREPAEGAARRFILGSLIAALLSAVVWLPSLAQYLTSGRQTSVLDGLASCNLLSRWNTTLLLLLATGSIYAILLVSRVLGEGRRPAYRKERILLLLLTIPIFLEPVNRMWHTGSYMSFPTRYGFMTLFMGLCCVLRVLPGAQEERSVRTRGWLALAGTLLAIGFGVFLVWFWRLKGDSLTSYTTTLWGSDEAAAGLIIVFASSFVAYGGLYLLYRSGLRRGAALALALVLILAEGSFNCHVYMISAQHSTQTYRSEVQLAEKVEEEGFWRIKTKRHLMDDNMEGAIGYAALSHYTSLTSQEYMFMMKHWGYSSYWMKVSSYGGTRFSDALLSVGYSIDSLRYMDRWEYANERFGMEKAELSLPLGLLYSGDLSEVAEVTERIPFQEAMFEALWPEEGALFERYEPTVIQGCSYVKEADGYRIHLEDDGTAYLEWTIRVEEKQTLYLDCFDSYSNRLNEKINGSFRVLVDGRQVLAQYPQQSYNGILELGTYEAEEVTVRLEVLENVSCASFGLYGMKEKVLAEAVEGSTTLILSEVANGLAGSAATDQSTQCLLTVPYDAGFTLRINGQVTEYESVLGGFISFTIPAGDNEITLTYRSPGFWTGLVLSAVGALLAILAWGLGKKKTAATKLSGGRCWAAWLCQAAAGIVLMGIYLFPLIWNIVH